MPWVDITRQRVRRKRIKKTLIFLLCVSALVLLVSSEYVEWLFSDRPYYLNQH